MLASANATALLGLEARPVRVEVSCDRGPPQFEMVGLAEASVRESRVRINAALAQMGILLGEHRIAVNLAPADLKKTGTAFDLAIAAATLAAIGQMPQSCLEGTLLIGELSLSGALRPVRGVLPQLMGARRLGIDRAIVPRLNANEAGVVAGMDVRIADCLGDVCQHLAGEADLTAAKTSPPPDAPLTWLDLSEVRGQHAGRRAGARRCSPAGCRRSCLRSTSRRR